MIRILEFLFPPKLSTISREDMAGVREYHHRINRRGVDNKPGMFVATAIGALKERRIFHLPGRTV